MRKAVEAILPHRAPFLFVDRIISLEPGKSAVAEFDVLPSLPVFQGHFPLEPILPGVLILEMLAQCGALAVLSMPKMRGKIAYLAAVESARFRRPVKPGETLRAVTELGPIRRGIGRALGVAYVDDAEVARATVAFATPN
ncbi:MAG: 3-hydroxyacyl-ACP dehydratase FabZ [Bacillota bacterium]